MKLKRILVLLPLLFIAALLIIPTSHRTIAFAQGGGQTINLTLKQTAVVGFTVTDNTGAAVPSGGYTATPTVGDSTIIGVGNNPETLQPEKAGTTTVQWTITGKGTYSGTVTTPGPDTVNVTSIPIGTAAVSYTVQ